ncbi:MAG TPA: FAD-dependent oxidoreductase, partial [Acidimicrobiia bacterium]|nr:FAD-dependent oxidoreductase [Acidimicrobiia bacterium]
MRIVVVGGGIAGLATALAAARAGHGVTILERDDTPMPADADAAFAWSRTGAPQVRHSHAFLARLRNLLRDRAPDVLGALVSSGATEIAFTTNLPPTLSDHDPRPGDDELVALACRRTTFEWVLRRLVLAEPGVELRHGCAAHALDAVPGPVPRVTGVDGLPADLVVDARGPRSSSAAWLAAIGAQPVDEELHESGIFYFSRFYRIGAGVEPPPYSGPTAADLGYLKYAIFLGDNGTFSITYAIERDDDELRRALVEPAAFETVARALVAVAPWRAEGVAEPITDVHVMAGLRNRYRPLVDRDGAAIVHGLVAVGDASVCTNPLYGRGCSLAVVHAFGLADTIDAHGDDLDGIARETGAFTRRELVPWFRSAVFQDAQARAMHEELTSEDPRAFMQAVFRDGLLPAMRTSPVVFRAFLRWFNLLVTPDALMSDPEIVNEVLAAYQDRDNHPEMPLLGPDRAELLALLSSNLRQISMPRME